ncbi:MAG TPA: endopeptidase La, partial [Longimicrobiaceae bacterium]|nr:endopeptidase La [Longimicrobiaceae bacterium]
MASSVLPPDALPEIPQRLPILPLEGLVVFLRVLLPLAVTIPEHVALLDEVLQSHKMIALALPRPGREHTESDPDDPPFFETGTLAQIVRMMKLPDGSMRILLQGMSRLRFESFMKRGDWWLANVQVMEEVEETGPELEALRRAVAQLFEQIVSLSPDLPDEVTQVLATLTEGGRLADFIAANAAFDVEAKQALLAEPNVRARLERLSELLGEELQILEYRSQIQNRVKSNVERTQREYWLREQMREIQKELGEGESGEVERLREEVASADLSDAARAQAEKELARLERMSTQSAEYQVVRTYLDWLLDLPWKQEAEEKVELQRAREILDRDHYDLEKVKERIVEYLAVRKLNPEMQGPLLCFVGPPGVGKTSLGRSIAEALGRPFVRISLGGVRDEAEIRGHRRTYVGAMPGRIIQALKNLEVRNPVFMLDEIDKVGQDFRGDPTAALLEVLDPAQNDTFVDHYLEIPFDLSRVIFIATANTLATIPGPLQDRMEVLQLSAYGPGEKLGIAKRYLLPRQIEAHGLTPEQVSVSEDALQRLIGEYTREAGVRELERQIAGLMRKAAVEIVEDPGRTIAVTGENLPRYAGPPRFRPEIAGREDEVGMATGLAWTPVGGEGLFLEAVRM